MCKADYYQKGKVLDFALFFFFFLKIIIYMRLRNILIFSVSVVTARH